MKISQLKEWLRLVRFSHTLFALPFAIGSLFVASGGLPEGRVFLLVLFCMVTARNTAMAFNRFADRHIDARNPRTSQRHLPAGKLSASSVLLFVAINASLFILGAWLLNPLAGSLAIPTLIVLCGYSLLKRFTWASQFGLGFALGLSPAGAWVAARGELSLFPILLGLVVLFWSAGFDTIYATQDYDIDRREGLGSIPARFGIERSLRIAMLLHFATIALAFYIGILFSLGWPWWVALTFAALAIVYEHFFHKNPSLERLNEGFFQANIAVSLLFMMGLVGCAFL